MSSGRGAGLHPLGASAGTRAVRWRINASGTGSPAALVNPSSVPEPPQLLICRDSLGARAGGRPQRRPWQNLRANSCGRGRENGAIWADPFARDARRTPPNKCAGLALTHRVGASVVGGLWIHADEGGRTNARSRDAATVQGVVVVSPWFEARIAAHRDCADEQHEGCQGTPRARHGNVPPEMQRRCGVTRLRWGKSTTREKRPVSQDAPLSRARASFFRFMIYRRRRKTHSHRSRGDSKQTLGGADRHFSIEHQHRPSSIRELVESTRSSF